MKKKIIVARVLLIILTVMCAVTIFMLSADGADESNAKSEVFSNSLAYEILAHFNLSEEQIENIFGVCAFLVRKLAHFTEYAGLGLLLAFTCSSFYKTNIVTFAVSQLAGSIYAASDEIHQLFVPGRSCQVRDVLIDSAGVLTGILFVLLVRLIHKKIYNKKQKKTNRQA